MAFPLLALLPAAFQIGQGIYQNAEANNLKESKYIPPELRMNRDLARTQRLSKRAPGAATAEENVRRNLATTLSASRRAYGGDAGKMAAVASAASGQANDANARIATMGERFSEGALGREMSANREIAGVQERNRREYSQTKAKLYESSGQNLFGGISNVASYGIAGGFDGIDSSIKDAANQKIAMGKDLNSKQAGRGAGGGDPYIQEGRAMKKAARKAIRTSAGDTLTRSRYGDPYGSNGMVDYEYQEYLRNKRGF